MSPMPSEGSPPAARSSESHRREADREIISLLRQQKTEIRQLVVLLQRVVGLLEDARTRAGGIDHGSADTGIWPSLM
jgi:hypothetical protein